MIRFLCFIPCISIDVRSSSTVSQGAKMKLVNLVLIQKLLLFPYAQRFEGSEHQHICRYAGCSFTARVDFAFHAGIFSHDEWHVFPPPPGECQFKAKRRKGVYFWAKNLGTLALERFIGGCSCYSFWISFRTYRACILREKMRMWPFIQQRNVLRAGWSRKLELRTMIVHTFSSLLLWQKYLAISNPESIAGWHLE